MKSLRNWGTQSLRKLAMEKYDLIGYSKKVEVYPMGDLWKLLPINCIILWHKIRARHTQGLSQQTLREEVAHLLQDKEVWWYSALYLFGG